MTDVEEFIELLDSPEAVFKPLYIAIDPVLIAMAYIPVFKVNSEGWGTERPFTSENLYFYTFPSSDLAELIGIYDTTPRIEVIEYPERMKMVSDLKGYLSL